jgi:transcriptional regulator with XRE-family HTH domain
MVGTKIRFIRESKKITQDFVANKLGISQTAYSKIESNTTQLTVDRLKEIAELLDVSETELINGSPINQFNIESVNQNFAYINTFMETNKDLYERLIAEKDDQIKQLKELLEFYKKQMKV